MSVRKFFLYIALFIFLFGTISSVLAQGNSSSEKEINLYFFWGKGCPHCAKEKVFLEKIQEKYPELHIYDFEVQYSAENRKLLAEFGKKLNVKVSGVPFLVVDNQYFIGWYDEKTTGKAIEEAIVHAQKFGCHDQFKELIIAEEDINQAESCEEKEHKTPIPETIRIPIIGIEVKTKNISLPLFTILLGALDGFNPCAMWTLLFLISLLLGMKDKKRMWILGGTFIFTSAAVYFLFMAAWLNLFLFIGFILWVRLIIGTIALGGGFYNLKEYFTNKQSGCKVTGNEKRQKVFEKLKAITQRKEFLLALVGIVILAAAVNLVELICSAGLPAVYTQVLSLNKLPAWQYYLYLLLYIFVFMFDDLFVFVVAMITLQMTGVTTKYTRFSHLVGGIIMVIIGILLIFKPEWLMFG